MAGQKWEGPWIDSKLGVAHSRVQGACCDEGGSLVNVLQELHVVLLQHLLQLGPCTIQRSTAECWSSDHMELRPDPTNLMVDPGCNTCVDHGKGVQCMCTMLPAYHDTGSHKETMSVISDTSTAANKCLTTAADRYLFRHLLKRYRPSDGWLVGQEVEDG